MLVDYLETLPDHQAVFTARKSLDCSVVGHFGYIPRPQNLAF